MIYYRSGGGSRDMSIGACRTLSLLSLLAYPAGALLLALGDNTLPEVIGGYGLIVIALICATPLLGSSLQRIVAEEPKQLDEYELQLRSKAMYAAYAGFTLLALLAVIYAAIASDKGGWVPSSYDEFNGLFWGIILYAAVLPAALLSWQVDSSFVTGRE